MKTFLKLRFFGILLLALQVSCGTSSKEREPQSPEVVDEQNIVADDDLNGLWLATVDGQEIAEGAVTDALTFGTIKLQLQDRLFLLMRLGDALIDIESAQGSAVTDGGSIDGGIEAVVRLTIVDGSSSNDVLEGSIEGRAVVLRRDIRPKDPIVVQFPGDRPFRQFLVDTLIPLAQQDRESYTQMRSLSILNWLKDCELYRQGSWLRSYMKGSTWAEQAAAFATFVRSVDNIKTTPRRLTKEYKFRKALEENIKDQNSLPLALTSFSMYFSAAAGRSLRMPITDDSMAYFITDRPSRTSRIGLVVMDTPTHRPLASTFGRQLIDLAEMPDADTMSYTRAMMELMVKSDVSSAKLLSGVGRSALTDWYAVMAIEDYRGVAFNNPNLPWGKNMVNVQFFGLIARTLARPGSLDAAGKPVIGQVIFGSELRPGEASYADVLNNGNDMSEYPDMSLLKTNATAYLRETHPDLVTEVELSFEGLIPKEQVNPWGSDDIFTFISTQLFDAEGRTAILTGARAERVINATLALIETLKAESDQFEAWLLANGFTKSNAPAPKSTGF